MGSLVPRPVSPDLALQPRGLVPGIIFENAAATINDDAKQQLPHCVLMVLLENKGCFVFFKGWAFFPRGVSAPTPHVFIIVASFFEIRHQIQGVLQNRWHSQEVVSASVETTLLSRAPGARMTAVKQRPANNCSF